MNKGRLLLFIFIFYAYAGNLLAQNIVVDDTYTAQQLVQNVLLNSPCANANNFSVSGDNFSGSSKSYGFFSYAGSTFPFSSGVVLSTSRAIRTQGPNSDLVDEGDTNWAGDGDLEQALGISGTVNATVLEFDFTPLTDKISFDYLFASEEYHGNAPCQYSDGFAFLLKPAGITAAYQNLALIPNTNIPVKVTSVHPLIPGACNAENETYFGGYNPVNYPINFDGQTTVMTAKATVIPGLTYHIKLVIADEQNIRYDSAIFLDGGSFNVGIDLGPDRLIATNNPVCAGQTLPLDATLPGTNNYQWYKNGTALPGETNPTYTVTTAGTYTVDVLLNSGSCTTNGDIVVEYAALPVLNSQTLVQCDPDNNGITSFNLTLLDNLVTGGNTALGAVSYYTTLANAQAQANAITNPTAFQNTVTNQVFASASNGYGCHSEVAINLVISSNSVTPPAPIQKCDGDGQPDGLTAFDLNSEVSPLITAGLPTGLTLAYYAAQNDAVLGNNPLPNNFTNTQPLQQTLFVKIVNGPDCYGIIPVTLQVLVFDPPQLQDETLYLCNGSAIALTVPNGFSGYLWSTGATGNSIMVNAAGSYSVTVTNSSGCTKTKVFTVVASGIAIINSVNIIDFNGFGNTVEVVVTGPGDYEFSLDGALYQNSPVFSQVEPGLYMVYVKDKNGCGLVTKKIAVLDYPRFFTPNGDGINDTWYIKNIQDIAHTKISIFDRFGKFIYQFNEKQNGWNGKTGQNQLPSTDYWFVVEFQDRNTVKGHFSLKR